jgi:hypothetical protein
VNGLILASNAGSSLAQFAALDGARGRSEARVKGGALGPRGHATVLASGGGIPPQCKFEWSRGAIGRCVATERLKRAPPVGEREAAIGDTIF